MADHVGSAGSSRSGGLGGTQFGDTTLTKVFVGGLAWETDRDTMRRYFEQFGDILEAVVITDKNTGRSKGYGFVTFRDPESARRACVDPTPVIDGRRANCNLASLGVRHRFGTPIYTGGRFRPAAAAPRFGTTPAYVSTYAQSGAFAYQQGYYPYSYATYSPEYYAQNLYAPYAALPQFYGSPNPAIYTYPGLGQPLQMPTSYTNLPQQYGFQGSHLIPYNSGTAISSIATVPPYLAGISTPTSVPSPGITTPAPIPQQFSVPAPSIPPYSLGSGAIQSSS